MLYIVGDGTVLAQQAGTSAPARFLLHDGQGSTRSLLDNGGTLLENYVYDAFGTLKAPTGTSQTRYLYTGQQFDAATKLYSLRARYYAPTQGRFTSRDTAEYDFKSPNDLNRYGYTANDPINNYDPTGFETAAITYPTTILQTAVRVSAQVAATECGSVYTFTIIASFLGADSSFIRNWAVTGECAAQVLYHYTFAKNIPSILLTGLRASDPANGDAQWGAGQYFTDLSPWESSTVTRYQHSYALFKIPWKWGSRPTKSNPLQPVGYVAVVVVGPLVQKVAPLFGSRFPTRSIYLNTSSSTLRFSISPSLFTPQFLSVGIVNFQPSRSGYR